MVDGDPVAMRPPGSSLNAFIDLCTRCGDCVSSCPEGVLVADVYGFPQIRFQDGACTFCGTCVEACGSGALDLAALAKWPWRAEIQPECLARSGVSCRICQDACDERAIRFRLQLGGRAEPVLDVDTCTGCGACAAACPAEAVGFRRHAPKGAEVA